MFFHTIKLANKCKHFACFGIIKLLCIYKFTAHMCPAIRYDNIGCIFKLCVSTVAIYMYMALIALQHILGAPAIPTLLVLKYNKFA